LAMGSFGEFRPMRYLYGSACGWGIWGIWGISDLEVKRRNTLTTALLGEIDTRGVSSMLMPHRNSILMYVRCRKGAEVPMGE
jgi:hypothetical protein